MKFDSVYLKRLVTKLSGLFHFFIKKFNMAGKFSFLVFIIHFWDLSCIKMDNFVHQCVCSACVQFPLDHKAFWKEHVCEKIKPAFFLAGFVSLRK